MTKEEGESKLVVRARQWFTFEEFEYPDIVKPYFCSSHARTANEFIEEWISKCEICGHLLESHGQIDQKTYATECNTLRAMHRFYVVCPGDWIVVSVLGGHYPVRPENFINNYMPRSKIDAEKEISTR